MPLSHVFGDLHASQSFADRDITDTEIIGEFLTEDRVFQDQLVQKRSGRNFSTLRTERKDLLGSGLPGLSDHGAFAHSGNK